ncbi:MAG: hypothetical protein WAM69_19500 [Candidatus Sulfotelmatobacter sp.]|jgi:predicted transcriptional regulator
MQIETQRKILDVLESRPKGTPITIDTFVDKHGLDREEVRIALEELEEQGKIQGHPLFDVV